MARYRIALAAGLLALGGGPFCVRTADAQAANTPRFAHTSTLLPDGSILIVGGVDGTGTVTPSVQRLASGVANDAQGLTTALNGVARASHTATLLPNGEVLVTGGMTGGGVVTPLVQIYNPIYNCWHDVDTTGAGHQMSSARYNHTATLLRSGPRAGSVLLCGGVNNAGTILGTCDVFDA